MRTRVQKLKKMDTTKPHYGRRIALLRGMRRLTQGQLGERTGYKQQEVSEFEGKQELPEVLAKGLDTTAEFVKTMDESMIGAMVFHTYDHSHGIENYNVNPLEEILKAKEEIKNLYERLLEAEKEKVAFLQRQLDSSK